MKQKKLIALLLSTALLLSGVNVQTSKAADEQKQQTVAVTLHMERDADTVLAPVTVTMTEDDKNNDFGIGLATGQAATYSPLRAFAKYLATKKKVTNDQMSKYIIASPSSYGGLWVSGLSLNGDGIGAASTAEQTVKYLGCIPSIRQQVRYLWISTTARLEIRLTFMQVIII